MQNKLETFRFAELDISSLFVYTLQFDSKWKIENSNASFYLNKGQIE